MYARVCDATGWTWDYVGQCVTLPRLKAMCKRWQDVPPVSESVAAFLGIKPTASIKRPSLIDNAALVADMHSAPHEMRWMNIPNERRQ